MQNISTMISTFFGVGKIKFAPGTFGSIAGVLLYFIIMMIYSFIINDEFISQIFFNNYANISVLIIAVIFFILGVYSSNYYADYVSISDPSEVVIDEVVGQIISLSMCFLCLEYFLDIYGYLVLIGFNNFILLVIIGSFISFRIFDIIKPMPICYFDQNVKGGFGIMLDDVIAAFMSTIFVICIFVMIDHFFSL